MVNKKINEMVVENTELLDADGGKKYDDEKRLYDDEKRSYNDEKSSSGGKNYDDEKRIVLWKNDKATEDNAQPAIRGQVTINGTKWYISLWNYTDKNGKTFCQGKVRKADEMVNTTQDSLF